MADGTKIEWTEATWNPVTGCSIVSPGCTNCYAMKLAGTRLQHHASRIGLTKPSKAGPVWTGEVRFNEGWLGQPLAWRRPRMIFVCAHGDLFHEGVPDDWIDQVFAVMSLTPQHTFQVLTKRSARMREYFCAEDLVDRIDGMMTAIIDERVDPLNRRTDDLRATAPILEEVWPLPNVWLGVSVEDQQRADERIPDLLATPAAVRWLSCEPLLGPVDLTDITIRVRPGEAPSGLSGVDALTGIHWDASDAITGIHGDPDPRIDWVVAGGESGNGARGSTAEVEANMRRLRDQCFAAGVPFFGKQNFKKLPLPSDLMVREMLL